MLTVADVLSIRHPEAPLRWSPDGSRVAFAHLADGVREFWEDTFGRMLAAFDRYLSAEPGKRPPAMI